MSAERSNRPYPDVDPRPDFPALERGVLERWRADDTFQRSIDSRPAGEHGANEFVFYDGPPFANGLPHFGHILTGYVKDAIPRYRTMRGQRVERRFGWDCHGLPAEMETEKELGVHGREQILELGIDRFNEHCRSSVQRYTSEWQRFVTRAARWVDFENDYKTMDLSYMESVLWAFKRLWDKGLVYEGFRVMPYSWAMQTPLSNFETRLDNAYRERQDPALTVRFTLAPRTGDEAPLDLLAWTTTPWTLPSNLALAVGPDIEYVLLELDGRRIALARAALTKYAKELEDAREVGAVRGSELAGRTYEPLFPFFADRKNAFRVLAETFVSTEDGTGVVHLAPGFGEDDLEACRRAGIDVVVPVDEAGCFTAEIEPYAGLQVFEANKPIIRDLKERGVVLRHETYLHNYPHCWRTDTPLIYRALTSWYVKVTAVRDRMVELNKTIRWIPEHIRDGLFGNWLEGARDWSISRNRFWGAPIPIWRSDDPRYPRIDVYGSLDELERDFGVRPTNLHRPFVDDLTRPNPDDPTGRSTMRRVTDVLDCWFESGSMPFAQVHYPFENREWFEDHAPADFIVEYIAQTRGWFYTLMVLSTALFDRPPFENCICHGVVLAADGQKLSKRLRNYPDPNEVFELYGADALRWHLISSPILRGLDLRISKDGAEIADVIRLVVNPVWNAYSFFTMYANADGVRAELRTDGSSVIDRYVLAKTRTLVRGVQEALDAYDLPGACSTVRAFLDALNNWYIRRSRDRFWSATHDRSKRDAYDTLYTVLHTLCRVVAPLLPLISDEIFAGLTGGESVHLADWPDLTTFPEDDDLVSDMDRVRDACSAALALREERRLRVRQPLAQLVYAGLGAGRLASYTDLLAEEVNVHEVRLDEDFTAYASRTLTVDARALGPRLGQKTKEVIAASKRGDWTLQDDGRVLIAGTHLEPGEFAWRLVPAEGVVCQALPGDRALVVLDDRLTPELIDEGRSRDVARAVQVARKEAGLHVSDRIELRLSGLDAEWTRAVTTHADALREQTLAGALEFVDGGADSSNWHVHQAPLEDGALTLSVALRRLEST